MPTFAKPAAPPEAESPAIVEIHREALPVVDMEATPAPVLTKLRYTEADIEMLAKTVWGEARGCAADEQRLVIWTVLQRVDADGWDDTIAEVVTAKSQFAGYDDGHPIDAGIYDLCVEVLDDWQNGATPPTHEIYAPTAPYFYFTGDSRGSHNYFREKWG